MNFTNENDLIWPDCTSDHVSVTLCFVIMCHFEISVNPACSSRSILQYAINFTQIIFLNQSLTSHFKIGGNIFFISLIFSSRPFQLQSFKVELNFANLCLTFLIYSTCFFLSFADSLFLTFCNIVFKHNRLCVALF
jgi:hypothetical protein